MYRTAKTKFFTILFFLTFWSNAIGQELILDQEFADFLMSQGQLDNANSVVLWADMITLDESVEISGLDLVILSNKIKTGARRITLLPPQEPIGQTHSGHKGRSVTVVAKEIVTLGIELPGGSGAEGQVGANGESGKPEEAERRAGGASIGTNGSKGGTGGAGGDGGTLTIWMVNSETPHVNFSAPGGIGGPGGAGGKGGSTFIYNVTKSRQGQPDIYGGDPVEKKRPDGPTGDEGIAGNDGVKQVRQIDVDRFADLVQEYVFSTPKDLEGELYQIIFLKNKLAGVRTLRQMSSGRFAQAYETENNNYRVVTQRAQNSNMQHWVFSPVGQNTFRIQQMGTERYLDAKGGSRSGFTRPRLRQSLSLGLFDVEDAPQRNEGFGAREREAAPSTLPAFALFTAEFNDSASQLWVLKPVGPDIYRIQQKSSRLFVQASESAWQGGFALTLSSEQESQSQLWYVLPVDAN